MWACDPAVTSAILDTYRAVGPLFTQALQAFLVAQCALHGDHLWPVDSLPAVLEDPNYDFVVIGAGSAGSVVANRLTEVPDWKVLLVEAGGNPNLGTEAPRLFFNNMKTTQDWGYVTETQHNACRSYRSKGCALPRGKVLGGSSSINANFYVRGNKLDYDDWANNGNYGWSYDDVLPYFKKSENHTCCGEVDRRFHSSDGYLSVETGKDFHDLEKIFIAANKELGLQVISDINGETQIGVTVASTTTKDGMRHSTARAFLSPVRERKNLYVLKHTLATRIIFRENTNEVTGIILNNNGREIRVNINKELILSAGAINTPQIMILSGLGPSDHLRELDIDVKADLPVGKNLQDHLFIPTFYKMPVTGNLFSLKQITETLTDFVLNQKGFLSNIIPNRVVSFINTDDSHSSNPDIQHHYFMCPLESYTLVDLFNLHELNEDVVHQFNDLNKHNHILIHTSSILKPKSRGQIRVASKNPNDPPLIYANYFENEDDMKTIINALKIHSYKLNETNSFKQASLQLQELELRACVDYPIGSDEYLECVARELTFSLYHQAGTVKMGNSTDETAVVDPELKVKNVKKLRVIDASIMPTIVSGNINAATIMIGEKGADMIKKEWLNLHTEL